jgi:hypothetical protein
VRFSTGKRSRVWVGGTPGTFRPMYLPDDDPRLTPFSLRAELLALGHSDRSLARAVRTGHLARPRRGVYVDGQAWREITPEQQYAIRARAAYRQARTEVLLSHTSALPLLDAPLWGFCLDDIHLTRRDGRTGRRERGIRQHCGQLVDGDVVTTHGLQLTSPIRATLEASTVGSVEATLAVANFFLHRGDFTIDQLRERYDPVMDRWPNSLATRLVLRLADARIESVGETRTSYFFWRFGLPRPIPQFEVYDGDVLVARLDFALPELGIWIEFDGKVKYRQHLRPGESVTDAVLREKRREERVAELTGWRCLRITWADLADPVRLERRVRELIASVAVSRTNAG